MKKLFFFLCALLLVTGATAFASDAQVSVFSPFEVATYESVGETLGVSAVMAHQKALTYKSALSPNGDGFQSMGVHSQGKVHFSTSVSYRGEKFRPLGGAPYVYSRHFSETTLNPKTLLSAFIVLDRNSLEVRT